MPLSVLHTCTDCLCTQSSRARAVFVTRFSASTTFSLDLIAVLRPLRHLP